MEFMMKDMFCLSIMKNISKPPLNKTQNRLSVLCSLSLRKPYTLIMISLCCSNTGENYLHRPELYELICLMLHTSIASCRPFLRA